MGGATAQDARTKAYGTDCVEPVDPTNGFTRRSTYGQAITLPDRLSQPAQDARQTKWSWAPTTKPGYEMLAIMDEYQAEDAAVDEARDVPGFDENRFRAAFRVGYAAGRTRSLSLLASRQTVVARCIRR